MTISAKEAAQYNLAALEREVERRTGEVTAMEWAVNEHKQQIELLNTIIEVKKATGQG